MYAARFLLAAIVIATFAGCSSSERSVSVGGSGDRASPVAFPPDRSAWTGAPAAAQVAHARALHAALETYDHDVGHPWAGGEASGVVIVVETRRVEGVMCRAFRDQINVVGAASQAMDIACWGDGWTYHRSGGGPTVLVPAFAEAGRIYTVRSGGSLADVARVTGARLAELEVLNPAMPNRLSPGTRILLP